MLIDSDSGSEEVERATTVTICIAHWRSFAENISHLFPQSIDPCFPSLSFFKKVFSALSPLVAPPALVYLDPPPLVL